MLSFIMTSSPLFSLPGGGGGGVTELRTLEQGLVGVGAIDYGLS